MCTASGIEWLKQENDALTRELEELRDTEERYRALVQNSIQALVVFQDGRCVIANPRFAELSGYTLEELYRFSEEDLKRHIHPSYRKRVWQRHLDRQAGKNVPTHYTYKALKRDGTTYWLETNATLIRFKGAPAVQVSFVDITHRKKAEKALREKERELKNYTRHLEKVNSALKVLIEHRDTEKQKLADNILDNLNKLVFPYLENLERTGLKEDQRSYLNIIKTNLTELLSSFAGNMSRRQRGLTLAEIRVADLIRQGRSSKEIAALLNISLNAVSFHRFNIRKKLGIKNQKINLAAYIQSQSL